ncbi:hypothetical protein BC939DRAFT_498946 [Gamsiella multidivaricata]|uniref:uncharacterized protein n=1 Tax=Gamsiella multidivaricata TaxID=101098 RepID=UPI00221F82D8|nr:uncharacterized protein BC939DRAFT_498946 [Gamsiella multidivaricata]KAG0358913.1 hypothetical protein BGZ54_010234 [Gamsiella multidivaricata]KAI7831505.1 hypothetical protein BC939DRAFT_498946 [Gamsiella multidivaricata]
MPVPTVQAQHPSEQESHSASAFESHSHLSLDPADSAALSAVIARQLANLSDIAKQTTGHQSSIPLSGVSSIDMTMKTDRKAHTHTASAASIATNAKNSTSTPIGNKNNQTSNNSSNNSSNITRKRKATNAAERRASTTDPTALAENPHTTISEKKKRALIDEHKDDHGDQEEEQRVVEVSSNKRKKRVVVTTPRSHSRQSHAPTEPLAAVQPVETAEVDADVEVDVDGMDTDEAPLQSNAESTEATAAAKHAGSRKSGSASASNSTLKKSSKGASESTTKSASLSSKRDSNANGDTKASHPSTTPSAAISTEAASSETKTTKSTKSRSTPQVASSVASPPPSAAAASSPPSDAVHQKRVLPSRGGMLRDKTGVLPIDATLFEPPIAPAGEYILYLANKQVLQRATVDPNRVPPAAYCGGADDSEDFQPLTAPLSSSSTTASSSLSKLAIPQLAPPPFIPTHIEVPIFRPCSISQFLQEEKKRRMQLLSKALAKAEAEAAAEALAHANSPSSATARAVSTRQKHKEIVNNQHVSVQTAVPSWSSHSHGRKATTTNTTLGKIEGIDGGAGPEENLSDEVYEKRHRKQEMAEKKVKNREKEKLRHAMYQQQLVVEKLRHIEINRLMPISAFRSLQKTVEQEQQQQQREAGSSADEATQQQHHVPISLAAAKVMQDQYHRRLLREAEENLRRYEQLGLGDTTNTLSAPKYSPFSRTKNRLATMILPAPKTGESSTAVAKTTAAEVKQEKKEKRTVGDGQSRKKVRVLKVSTEEQKDDGSAVVTNHPKTKEVSSAAVPSTKTVAAASSTSAKPASSKKLSTTTAKPEEAPTPPKPITTFIKPGSVLASGARKSSRVALAFGEKVPILERMDFDLPMEGFGDMLLERAKSSAILTMELQRRGLLGGIDKETTDQGDAVKDKARKTTEASSVATLPNAPLSSALTSASSLPSKSSS